MAELKLSEEPPLPQFPFEFPRLHRRGRIEAPETAESEIHPIANFHGFTAVAELKLGMK